jgi:small subunit ribosomal protein S21
LLAALFVLTLCFATLLVAYTESSGVKFFMQIMVRDNNVDQALRALKKKLQREGVYREMKLRRHFEKPSEKRAREKAAAVRRARKMERKQQERDGAK